jgi:hypothetical protein
VKVEGAPTATGAGDAAEFVERLGQLRVWAGRPSFRHLATLAGTTVTPDGHVVDRLPPSTVSDVLAGKRLPHLPRMDMVGAFVETCLRVCHVPPDSIEKATEAWLGEWRRLAGLARPGDAGRVGGREIPADVPMHSGVEFPRGDGGDKRPLVGREDALRHFARALHEMAAGRSHVIAVAGEPGAGKTRLLAELATMAAARRDVRTLWGRPGELEREMPLGVMVDALDDHLEDRAAWVRERLGAERFRHLSAVLPSLSAAAMDDAAPPASGAQAPARYRVYRAVRRLLGELAAPSGLVMILDDVHEADAASVELIDHLIRHPPRGRVLLAFAYRPAQVAPRLTALIESGFRHVRPIAARPFTLPDVEAFAGLSAGGAPAPARAVHMERSARVSDHTAVTVLIEAARTATLHAPVAARRWLSAALRLLPGDSSDSSGTGPSQLDDSAIPLELLLELATVQTAGGRWPDDREAIREARDCCRSVTAAGARERSASL